MNGYKNVVKGIGKIYKKVSLTVDECVKTVVHTDSKKDTCNLKKYSEQL